MSILGFDRIFGSVRFGSAIRLFSVGSVRFGFGSDYPNINRTLKKKEEKSEVNLSQV